MDRETMLTLAEQFLGAWNRQEVCFDRAPLTPLRAAAA